MTILENNDIDKDILENIYIDIFKKCWYIDNRYGLSINRTPLLTSEGSWYWAHSLEPMVYSNWLPGEPGDDSWEGNCAMMQFVPDAMDTWVDQDCFNDYGWPIFSICQQNQ